MKRALAAMPAAIFICAALAPALGGGVHAAERVRPISLETPPRQSHLWAYTSLIVGGGLIAGSFPLADRANETYDRYLVATDPEEIDRLFNRTEHLDRLSSGSLLAGQVFIAAGLYLRFLRQPSASRLSFSAGPDRCQVAWRF